MQKLIYFDCNATHPLLTRVRKNLAEALLVDDARLSNPSSIHKVGQKSKRMVAELRSELCQFLGRPDGDEFIFLSGATEALNLAIRSFVADRKIHGRVPVLLTTTVEHSAVIDTFSDLKESRGVQTHVLPVNIHGQPSHEEIFSIIQENISRSEFVDVLCVFQLCNNETGVVYNLDTLLPEIESRFGQKILRDKPRGKGGKFPLSPKRVWICLDGAQALGKMPDDFIRRSLHYGDYMSISAHKMGGPQGIGTLWMRPEAPFKQQMTGGVQERRRRAGTPNTLGLLGFLEAVREWQTRGQEFRSHMTSLRQRLVDGLRSIDGLVLHGLDPSGNLPGLCNSINFHFEGCPEESLLLCLDLSGVCVSSGSACNSGSLKPSRVLMAMGYSPEIALSSLRATLGAESVTEDVDAFVELTRKHVNQIRASRAKAREILPDISVPSTSAPAVS